MLGNNELQRHAVAVLLLRCAIEMQIFALMQPSGRRWLSSKQNDICVVL
jgi:hypothetical protein